MTRARDAAVAIAAVLFVWAFVLVCESLLVGWSAMSLFAGAWEIAATRRVVLPIAVGALVPAAPLVVALGMALDHAPNSRGARAAMAFACAMFGASVALGVSTGRHFASWALRAPFAITIALAGAFVGGWILPRLAIRAAASGPRHVALAAASATVCFWCADAFVLPRLYPAFHLALFTLTLTTSAVLALPIARAFASRPRNAALFASIVLVASVVAIAYTPAAAARLARSDNVRLVLAEHAPLLGRAAVLATHIAPPPPIDADDGHAPSPGEIPRALDWSGRDIVLVSIDALRADHVGAYGYARATTPNIDALAREGMRFTSAYCPTPHTSYSITSLMTGKYMRPLLALGVGDDSETWAGDLRRYGYRTAAFYPPAVFFIDESRFVKLKDRMLDFEYAKIEFATAAARADQVGAYLASAGHDKPLFLWVHLFEPHEPYVVDPAHPFGGDAPTDVDRYDSEIASADDGVGAIVRRVRAERPGAVVVVTADHGEEFGEHGGRYHGTTVYEEQVRVPLIVVGAGVAPRASSVVVQTIDLLPTVLSALGIPRPARVRGRDLGPVLHASSDPQGDLGLAFAETDDYALLAEGEYRLVCARKVAACAQYRPKDDPNERLDVSARGANLDAMKQKLRAIEREQGRFEGERASAWPEAIRRGLQGDAEAAIDVAALLDDASVTVRRKAAEVTYDLREPSVAPQVRRALAREEDDVTRRWSELALVRMGDAPSPRAESLLHDADVGWRRAAALALAERGDTRAEAELAAWWAEAGPPRGAMELDRARPLLAALAKIKARTVVPALVRSLEDVRMRPDIARTLGAIGDPSANKELLDRFTNERYVTTRPHEARALVLLGARAELHAPLARFAGVPEPMIEAIDIAREAGMLTPSAGGVSRAVPASTLAATLTLAPTERARRLLVLTSEPEPAVSGTVAGKPLGNARTVGAVHFFELGQAHAGDVSVALAVNAPNAILAAWIVARADEIPPPPPEPWHVADGGAHESP